jgi:hypothetical protein
MDPISLWGKSAVVDSKSMCRQELLITVLRDNGLQQYENDSSDEYDYLPTDALSSISNFFMPRRWSNGFPDILYYCNLETGGYPYIEIRLSEPEQSEYIDKRTIIYDPDDYLEPLQGGRCRFKIRESHKPRFGLNFLAIIATHFKSNQISFCDPAQPTIP